MEIATGISLILWILGMYIMKISMSTYGKITFLKVIAIILWPICITGLILEQVIKDTK